MKNITITDTRKQIYSIAEDIAKNDSHYVITERGEPKMVMMSVEEFESWKETLEVMALYPNLLQEAEDARQRHKEGKSISLEDLQKELDEEIPSQTRHTSEKKFKKVAQKLSNKNSKKN